MSNTETEVIALDELIEEVDEDMVSVIFESFMEDTQGAIEEICTAISEAKPELLRKKAHRLKGCLISIKAHQAASLAKKLEDYASCSDIEKASDYLSSLKDEFKKVIDYINQYDS